MTKRIAITLGDPGGIGPEVALKALAARRWPRDTRFVLIGSRALVRREARRLGLPVPPPWRTGRPDAAQDPVSLWEPEPPRPAGRTPAWQPGVTGAAQARAAARWIRAGVEGCLAGRFDGLVTGPVCKRSLRLAGLSYPGHTEYLAALTRTRRVAMMLIGGPLRVVLATRHEPLARVPACLTVHTIETAVELAARGAAWLGAGHKPIGVCALNPHAGDGGILGREERQTLAPALRALRRRGFSVEGPVPGDVIFYQALRGRFGVVVAMYHDQGLGPLKMVAFESGVNLTLGLPIIRTSPDHGTAFDIAGTGRAHAGSMRAAIELAIRLARRRNPWARPSGAGPRCGRAPLRKGDS